MSMEGYLNELSFEPLAASKDEACDKIIKLISTLKATKDKGVNIVRCIDQGIHSIMIAADYSLYDYCLENSKDPKASILFSYLQPPYIQDDTEIASQYVETQKFEAELQDEEGNVILKETYGLAAAYLTHSFGINFNTPPFWSKATVVSLHVTDADGCVSIGEVPTYTHPEDLDTESFEDWLVTNRPRVFPTCPATQKKGFSLSSEHHTNKVLEDFSKKILQLPYIKEVVTSLRYCPKARKFVRNLQEEAFRIELTLYWTEEGCGMVVATTARDKVELRQMAEELENWATRFK